MAAVSRRGYATTGKRVCLSNVDSRSRSVWLDMCKIVVRYPIVVERYAVVVSKGGCGWVRGVL